MYVDDFLYKKRKNQSGILQRFVEPSGGGKHNSQIRAICSPTLCVLERRRTKQELHDLRFGLYERAVTFEGPEVHSISLPIRGETLPGKLRSLCHRVLNHMSDATRSIKTSQQKDVRMVLHLKVDSKDRIWLLYSSSIRTIFLNRTFLSDQSVEFVMEDHHMPQESDYLSNDPLNIEDVIKLSPKIKLSQIANHDTAIDISNTKEFRYCASCGLVQLEENFHPVPYKTVVTHFEQVILKSGTQWPPPKEIIKSAGGVGFGQLAQSDKVDSENEIDEEDLLIPPVIRHFHKRLKAEGYRRYRSDPLFLHKHCSLCETCFLSYANLVSTSFQIKLPIKLHKELKHLRFDSKNNEKVLKGCDRKQNAQLRTIHNYKQVESFCSNVSLTVPTFPHAIIDPPTKVEEVNLDELMPLPYERIESPSQPLMHLLQMHEALEKSKMKRDKNSLSKTKLNPYEVPLKIVDRSVSRKTKNKTLVESPSEFDYGSGSITAGHYDEKKDSSDSPLNRDEEVITLLSNTLTEMIARVSL